jgi:hypothetical protein
LRVALHNSHFTDHISQITDHRSQITDHRSRFQRSKGWTHKSQPCNRSSGIHWQRFMYRFTEYCAAITGPAHSADPLTLGEQVACCHVRVKVRACEGVCVESRALGARVIVFAIVWRAQQFCANERRRRKKNKKQSATCTKSTRANGVHRCRLWITFWAAHRWRGRTGGASAGPLCR